MKTEGKRNGGVASARGLPSQVHSCCRVDCAKVTSYLSSFQVAPSLVSFTAKPRAAS